MSQSGSALSACYENDDRFIPVHQQPACLIDLALARDVDSHRLLRGTGLFLEHLDGVRLISPQQFLRLFDNALHQIGADDTSFQFGHRLLPGHYGGLSTALAHAQHFAEALDLLLNYRSQLSPLLAPRLHLDERHVCLYWLDVCGVGSLRPQLVETCMTAVSAMCRWQSGERWPWQFLFSHAAPTYREQYQAHLGEALYFDCQVDAMVLPRAFFLKPWPRASHTVAALARRQAEQQRFAANTSLVEQVFQQLLDEVRTGSSLDAIAIRLGISPATCKRKLKAHGWSFQALHDAVRKHVALYLYWGRGYGSEAVAGHLGFHDRTNFRRSFKRWTGQLPSVLRQYLPQTG